MNFKRAEPSEWLLLRFVSDTGVWEMGFHRVMFGLRVVLNKVGKGTITLNYCAGADQTFQANLLMAVMIILKKIPEDVEEWVIEQQFPGYTVKPINLDPTCWIELQRMRDKVLSEEL